MSRRARLDRTERLRLGAVCALLLASSLILVDRAPGTRPTGPVSSTTRATTKAPATPPRSRPAAVAPPAQLGETRLRLTTTRRAAAAVARPRRAPLTRYAASGDLVVAKGTGPVLGSGPLRRFSVEVEAGLGADVSAFAAAVEAALGDARGWTTKLGISLQRVDSGPVAFRVTLASPYTTDRLCRPLRTGGVFSCFMRGRSVVNAARWRGGADAYGEDLATYRTYVVNHEVGHALGFGHRSCPGRGRPAPVMLQQTKGLQGCRANAWPVVA